MRLLSALIVCAVGFVQPVMAQTKTQNATPQFETRQLKRTTFSGSETLISELYLVQADCTGYQEPEVRMVAKPKNGDVRFEQRKVPISFNKESSRFHCNGKPVDSVAVIYKSKEGFVGSDQMSLDVNYRTGFIIRNVVTINVR